MREGRIAAITPADQAAKSEAAPEPGLSVVEADGLWLCPGFVDIHTHYDIELELAPALGESLRHGVTAVVIGGCSLSLTVGAPGDLARIFQRVETLPGPLIRRWLESSRRHDSPAAYLEHLASLPLGPSVAPMLGHSALRCAVMGLDRAVHELATPDELEAMRTLAAEALDAGCIGISVDLVHWHKVSAPHAGMPLPSHRAALSEIRALAELCRARDAVFQATPDPRRPWTLLWLLGLSVGLWRAPLRLTVLSAIDVEDRPWLWRLFPLLTRLVNGALDGNLRFQTLPEPFHIWSDGPLTPLFEEFSTGVQLNNCEDSEARRALWQDAAFRARFRAEWTASGLRSFHRDLARMTVVAAPDETLVGRTFAELAAARGVDATELFMDLLAEHDEALRWHSAGANARPGPRARLLRDPGILPGFSDAGAHARNLAFFDSAVTLLREAVQRGVMPVAEAVRRVTSEPARWFGLDHDRDVEGAGGPGLGRLRVGARADLVLIDPARLRAPTPTPEALADPVLEGATRLVKRDPDPAVRAVWVAGERVVEDGGLTEAPGRRRLGELLAADHPVRDVKAARRRWQGRIDDETLDHPFESYWPVFLLKHRDRRNVALHALAVVIMWIGVVAAAAGQGLAWLILIPASQALGLLGHRLFEPSAIDPGDALWSVRAVASLHRLFGLVVSGRYGAELARYESELEAWRGRHQWADAAAESVAAEPGPGGSDGAGESSPRAPVEAGESA